MMKWRNVIVCTVLGGVMLWAAGCSSTQCIPAYQGSARPLEEVAVLRGGVDTCPVFTIDGVRQAFNRQANAEFHLAPGTHAIEVFYQVRDAGTRQLAVRRTAVEYDFAPGRVYAIAKTTDPVSDASSYRTIDWTPNVQDLGDVVTYAADNPDYYAGAKPWKQLRQDNGLTKSWFDIFQFASDEEEAPKAF